MKLLVAAFVLAAVVPARAHHPFTPYYDESKLVSVTGAVVEFRYVNPHAVLIVDGTTSDGRSGRWAFEGLSPNALYRNVKDVKEKLRAEAHLTISGWAAKDPTVPAFSASEVTFDDGSKMVFGSLTAGASDVWHCLAEKPCPAYRYPQVTSN